MRMFPMLAAVAMVAPAPLLAQANDPAAKAYVAKAGASDLYEIQSSQMIRQDTQNPQLRQYADMMITDHTKSTADVTAAARAAGMKPMRAKLDATGTRNLTALRRAKGEARDRLYVEQQKASHQMALQVHQDYAANGTVQPLKDAATAIVPVVQHHIEMIAPM